MPAIMSLAVDDRRQVSSLFIHRDCDYNNYYLNKNFGYINSVEKIFNIPSKQIYSLSNKLCLIVLFNVLVHHILKKETTVPQLSTEEGSNLEGNVK